MLILKNIRFNRIFLTNNALRQSNSLPKALPNKDEFCEAERKQQFAPPKLLQKRIELPKMIQITEKNIKETKLKKDWYRMESNGLIAAYLQVCIFNLILF